jgi:hypothetical protein
VDIHSEEFTRAVQAAVAAGREETLRAGVSLFYFDRALGIEVMEQPDGRKFQIRYVKDAPRERNYEVLGEVTRVAA